ncbi:hypothetical protein QJQ45_016206, partial [Haematococcus lacustris]
STYTDVYAKGGPKAVDAPKNDLAVLLDRSDADVRGVKLAQPAKVMAQAKSKEVQAVRKPPQAPCAQARPETIRTSASQEFVTHCRTEHIWELTRAVERLVKFISSKLVHLRRDLHCTSATLCHILKPRYPGSQSQAILIAEHIVEAYRDMSCFCFGSRTVPRPEGPPDDWDAQDVRDWLLHNGLQHHTKGLAQTDGKTLLAMDKLKVQRLVGPASGPLLSALEQLRSDAARLRVRRATAWDCGQAHLSSSAHHTSNCTTLQTSTEQCMQVHAPAEAHPGGAAASSPLTEAMLQLPLTDRVTEESVVEVGPHNILLEANAGLLLHAMNPAQGPRDWAQALMSILPEGAAAADPDSIACFLGDLGKGVGAGLVEAVLTTSAFAPVFVNAYGLVNSSKIVMVNKENCAKASGLAQDVLHVLDISWRRFAAAHQAGVNPSLVPGAGVPDETLETLAFHLRHLLSLVAPFTAPGWLLHAACNKKLKERFDGGHNALVDCVKAAGLDVLLGGKALARGDYRDPVRAVRRLLQSHGAGSVTKGLCYYKAKADTGAVVHELVTLLDLGAADDDMVAAAVRAELAAVPTESGMDVDVYYNSLVAGENTGHDTSNDAVFDWYDKDCAGYLEMEQFQEVLTDLGLLEDRSDTDAAAYLTASFKMADKEGLGRLDRAAFCAYYSTLTASGARQQLLARMGLPTQESLRSLFHAFASFGSRTEVNDMDAARFVKMVKDAHLLCNQLSIADADIIFKRCKAKASRRISFEQFLAALLMCAEKKGSSLEAVVQQVLDAGGPVVHGVAPESVRLHDDKSTYTGVYAKGGPKAVDAPKNDLAVLLDRSDADVRGVKLAQPAKVMAQAKSKEVQAVRKPPQAPCAQARPETIRTSASQEFVTRRRTDSSGGGVGSVGGLRDKFAAFAMFGHAPHPGHGSKLEMDGSSFAKLCRDCKLLDKKFTLTRADLIFQSVKPVVGAGVVGPVKPVGHRAIGFAEFKKALELVATEKAAEAVDIINIVCCSGGPLLSRSTRT